MHSLYKLPFRLKSLFRGNCVERELNDELRFHLETRTEEYGAKGMTRRRLVTQLSGNWAGWSRSRRSGGFFYNGLTTRRNLNSWKSVSAVRISTTPCSLMSAAI